MLTYPLLIFSMRIPPVQVTRWPFSTKLNANLPISFAKEAAMLEFIYIPTYMKFTLILNIYHSVVHNHYIKKISILP